MQRRTFLIAAAALGATARHPVRAATPGVWTRLPGRPEGGLPVLVLSPGNTGNGAGPHPVIIFSHGLGGRPEGFSRLVAPWVEAGFLLLLPRHLDSLDRGAPRHPSFPELERFARLRIDDIGAMLAAVPMLAAAAGASVAEGEIGLGGHSFGAWTAAVIAGATVFTDGGRGKSFADPRPRAFFLLAPTPVPAAADALHPFDGLTPDSFGGLTRPLLLIDGTSDLAPSGGPESYRERLAAYTLSPPGNKYLGIARDSTHATIAGIAPAGDPHLVALAERSLASVKALSQPFWLGFVGGRKDGVAWLDGPAPYAIDPGNFTFARRLG